MRTSGVRMSGVNWWLVAVGNLLVYVPLWWWLQGLEVAAK